MARRPDLTAYHADVTEHALMGAARSRLLEDVRGEDGWEVALDEGTLRIGERTYRTQILGTFSASARTFMWAWGNPGAADWGPSTAAALALKGRASADVFGARVVAEDLVDARELAFVAGELAGGHPVFLGGYDGGCAMLLVTDLPLDPASLPIVYVPGLLGDLATYVRVPPLPCIRRFAQRTGFAVEEPTARKLIARRKDGTFEVELDRKGRIEGVELVAGGR